LSRSKLASSRGASGGRIQRQSSSRVARLIAALQAGKNGVMQIASSTALIRASQRPA
jgi:hypothetical protein